MRVLNMFFSPEGLVPADVTFQVEKAKLKKKKIQLFPNNLNICFLFVLEFHP